MIKQFFGETTIDLLGRKFTSSGLKHITYHVGAYVFGYDQKNKHLITMNGSIPISHYEKVVKILQPSKLICIVFDLELNHGSVIEPSEVSDVVPK